MEEPLITVEDVARLLKVKPSTVYDAVARGRLPAIRLWRGRRRSLLRFRREDVERFLREKSVPATETQ